MVPNITRFGLLVHQLSFRRILGYLLHFLCLGKLENFFFGFLLDV